MSLCIEIGKGSLYEYALCNMYLTLEYMSGLRQYFEDVKVTYSNKVSLVDVQGLHGRIIKR